MKSWTWCAKVKVESSAEAREVWQLKKEDEEVSLTVNLMQTAVNEKLTADCWYHIGSWSETVRQLMTTKQLMNIEAADEWEADIRGSDETVWLTEEAVICSQNWSF